MSVLDHLGKKYKLDKSENFDQYLKALGVGLVGRQMMKTISPILELTKNGDEFTFTTITSLSTIVLKFKLGVEFEQSTADGRTAKTIFTIEGNVLKEVQKDVKTGKELIIERIFSANEIKMVASIGDVTTTRTYKLQQ